MRLCFAVAEEAVHLATFGVFAAELIQGLFAVDHEGTMGASKKLRVPYATEIVKGTDFFPLTILLPNTDRSFYEMLVVFCSAFGSSHALAMTD